MATLDKTSECIYDILIAYITEKYNNDTLFCCISGCDKTLISFIEDNSGSLDKNHDYYISSVYGEKTNFTFDKIVKIRNNKCIRKIVVFTNASINNIDSLKDFIQIDIKSIKFKDIWHIIERRCALEWRMHKRYKSIMKFLENIAEILKPDIYDLIVYLQNVDTEYNNYKDLIFSLNINLYLFSIWSSASSSIIHKTKLRALVHNSEPSQIHKKIKSPKDINQITKKKSNIDKPELFMTVQEMALQAL